MEGPYRDMCGEGLECLMEGKNRIMFVDSEGGIMVSP